MPIDKLSKVLKDFDKDVDMAKAAMVRFGLLLPSSNTTMEPEFYRMLPKGFTVHTARMRLRRATIEELTRMEEEMEEAAEELADADVDVIGYGCTSGSLIKGLGHDKEIVSEIERITGKPAVATAGSVLEALRSLASKRLAVATPYIEEVNEKEEIFLRDNGFEFVDFKGLGLADNVEIGKQDPMVAYNLVKQLNCKDADGIFISCTNFRTIEVIEKLETEYGKPVVSSNTATLWDMIRKVGVRVSIAGYGRLFTA